MALFSLQRLSKSLVRQQFPPGVILTPGSIQQHLRTFLVVRTEGGCHWGPAAGGWVAVNRPVVHRAAADRAVQPETSAMLRP